MTQSKEWAEKLQKEAVVYTQADWEEFASEEKDSAPFIYIDDAKDFIRELLRTELESLLQEMELFESRIRNVKRAILYTDTIDGLQTCRDDLWAISSSELSTMREVISKRIKCYDR